MKPASYAVPFVRCVNNRGPIIESKVGFTGSVATDIEETTIADDTKTSDRFDLQRNCAPRDARQRTRHGIGDLSPDKAFVRGHRRDSDPMQAL
jgi:hypothetical protein